MAVNVGRTSRLVLGELKSIDGIEFWDMLDLPVFVPRVTDLEHIVADVETIDSLAQQYYQDPILWWVIAWANGLEIIPLDMKVGMTLIIPDPSFVKNTLLRGKFRQGS